MQGKVFSSLLSLYTLLRKVFHFYFSEILLSYRLLYKGNFTLKYKNVYVDIV